MDLEQITTYAFFDELDKLAYRKITKDDVYLGESVKYTKRNIDIAQVRRFLALGMVSTAASVIKARGFKSDIGYIAAEKDKKGKYYIDVYIKPRYRKRGIVPVAEKLMVKKHNIKDLYARIDKANKLSLSSHKHSGFILDPDWEGTSGLRVQMVKHF